MAQWLVLIVHQDFPGFNTIARRQPFASYSASRQALNSGLNVLIINAGNVLSDNDIQAAFKNAGVGQGDELVCFTHRPVRMGCAATTVQAAAQGLHLAYCCAREFARRDGTFGDLLTARLDAHLNNNNGAHLTGYTFPSWPGLQQACRQSARSSQAARSAIFHAIERCLGPLDVDLQGFEDAQREADAAAYWPRFCEANHWNAMEAACKAVHEGPSSLRSLVEARNLLDSEEWLSVGKLLPNDPEDGDEKYRAAREEIAALQKAQEAKSWEEAIAAIKDRRFREWHAAFVRALDALGQRLASGESGDEEAQEP